MGQEALKLGQEALKPSNDTEKDIEAPDEEAPLSEVKSHRASMLKSLREDSIKSLAQIQQLHKKEGR